MKIYFNKILISTTMLMCFFSFYPVASAVYVEPAPGTMQATPRAFCAGTPQTFADIICILKSLVSYVIPLLTALALLVFAWGVVKFIANAGNEKVLEEAKHILFWGVVALFVMFSIAGIISFFASDFNGYGGVPRLPTNI